MQDTPAIKFTYDASVTVPIAKNGGEYVVKMSANETSVKDLDESHRLYQF